MKIRIRKWVKIVLVLIILIIGVIIYSRYIEPKSFKVKEYSVVDRNLPSNFYGLKIIHISDIHYKVTTTLEDLKEIIKEINILKPDIVVFTGDLFDKNIEYENKDYEDLTQILSSIDYNIEKFFIKGEQDLNIDKYDEIMSNSNFSNIGDSYETVFYNDIEPILLVGINSNYENNHINETLNDIYSKINDEYNYSILILHEPDFIDEIDYSKFNLILAGHSHNGQIKLPFIGGIIRDKYAKKYYNEYYELNNTKVYISSGIGTSKYKFRFLNKPSINLYRLRNK